MTSLDSEIRTLGQLYRDLPIGASVQGASTVHKDKAEPEMRAFSSAMIAAPTTPTSLPGLALRGRNQWRGGEAKLRRDMMAYFDAMGALCDRMLPPVAVALGMPADYFAPFFADEAHAVVRFLHYPPQPEVEDNLCGQTPRTDNSFMTALARTDVRGLALRLPSITSSGDQSWRKLLMSSG